MHERSLVRTATHLVARRGPLPLELPYRLRLSMYCLVLLLGRCRQAGHLGGQQGPSGQRPPDAPVACVAPLVQKQSAAQGPTCMGGESVV